MELDPYEDDEAAPQRSPLRRLNKPNFGREILCQPPPFISYLPSATPTMYLSASPEAIAF